MINKLLKVVAFTCLLIGASNVVAEQIQAERFWYFGTWSELSTKVYQPFQISGWKKGRLIYTDGIKQAIQVFGIQDGNLASDAPPATKEAFSNYTLKRSGLMDSFGNIDETITTAQFENAAQGPGFWLPTQPIAAVQVASAPEASTSQEVLSAVTEEQEVAIRLASLSNLYEALNVRTKTGVTITDEVIKEQGRLKKYVSAFEASTQKRSAAMQKKVDVLSANVDAFQAKTSLELRELSGENILQDARIARLSTDQVATAKVATQNGRAIVALDDKMTAAEEVGKQQSKEIGELSSKLGSLGVAFATQNYQTWIIIGVLLMLCVYLFWSGRRSKASHVSSTASINGLRTEFEELSSAVDQKIVVGIPDAMSEEVARLTKKVDTLQSGVDLYNITLEQSDYDRAKGRSKLSEILGQPSALSVVSDDTSVVASERRLRTG